MIVLRYARRWWPVGLGAILGILAALAFVAMTPKSYTATVTLFVGSAVSPDSSVAYNLDLFSQQRALTYSQLAQSREIAVKVQQDLGLAITPEELSAKVSAAPVLKTVLMKISFTDSSAKYASDIANAFATEFTQYVARLETPVGSEQPTGVVTVVQTATPPMSPTSPNVLLIILVGLGGGLLLGLLAKWLMRVLDRRVRTTKHVEECTGAPVLGVLPKDSARQNRRLNIATEPTSAYAEAVRKLRANFTYANVDAPPKTIAFIAPTSTVSTTATATNLAVVLDGAGRHVALIDADMRESRLAPYIGELDAAQVSAHGGLAGLSSVLIGNASFDEAILRVPATGVDILLAGPPLKTAGEMLASDALAKVFAESVSDYDFVFCDTPGLLTVADAAEIGRVCDGVLLVATQGKTRIDRLTETAETLRAVGAKVVGTVLTDAL